MKFNEDTKALRPMTKGEKEIAKGLDEFFEAEERKEELKSKVNLVLGLWGIILTVVSLIILILWITLK